MKLVIGIFLLCILSAYGRAQTGVPDDKYQIQIYHPDLKAYHTSYNYSDLWDIDGDGLEDSVLFVGNGGAHAYYHLRLSLSSGHVVHDFPFLSIDMPYQVSESDLTGAFGFEVRDFNHDGVKDIRIVLDSHSFGVDEEWKKKGVKTKDVVVSVVNGNPILTDRSDYLE